MIACRRLFSLLLTLILLGGCGGGTSGTGGVTLSGAVYDVSSQPIAGVRVSEASSGNSIESDAQGKFELRVPQLPSVLLVFEVGTASAAVEIGDVADSVALITAEFKFDTEKQTIRAEHVQLRERGKASSGDNSEDGEVSSDDSPDSGAAAEDPVGSPGKDSGSDTIDDSESSKGSNKGEANGKPDDSHDGKGQDSGEASKGQSPGKPEDTPGQGPNKGSGDSSNSNGKGPGGGGNNSGKNQETLAEVPVGDPTSP